MPESFTCPRCGATSYNPNDIAYRYCGHCQEFAGDETRKVKRKKRKQPPEPLPRRKREPIGPDLMGNPCEHTFERYRGFMMCSQPLCAALQTKDGYELTRAEMRALIDQLRLENKDMP